MATALRDLEALERLHGEFGLRYDELARAVSTTESTLHRWRRGTGGEPTPVYVARLSALQSFLDELEGVFANRDAARAWLERPLGVLKGASPRSMIAAGHVDRVTGVLYAINAGAAL